MSPLEVARAYYKQGIKEATGNNDGPMIEHFLRERAQLNWCAGFVLTCFSEAGQPLPGNFFENRAVSHLAAQLSLSGAEIPKFDAEPGDVVVFKRAGGGHIGIVDRITERGGELVAFYSLEGNVGNALRLVRHGVEDPSLVSVYHWEGTLHAL